MDESNAERVIYLLDRDAEARALIQSFLTRCDPNWKVIGFPAPAAVLEACANAIPDVALVDLSSPGGSDGLFLDQLRTVAPSALRMVMTGHLPQAYNSTLPSAHQYLFKPAIYSELFPKLRRAFLALSRLAHNGARKHVLAIRSFPSLPSAYNALIAEIRKDKIDLSTIAELAAPDAGLSTTLMRLANSPLFGTHVVSDLLEALMVLGIERSKAIVVSQAVMKGYGRRDQPVSAGALWAHAWQTAALAKRFCARAGLETHDGDIAFLAGLLHNTGRFVLVDTFTRVYQKALAGLDHPLPLAEVEKNAFHITGEELTGFLLDLWGMLEEVATAAALHEHPWDEPMGGRFTATTAVYLANHFSHQLHPPDRAATPPLNPAYLEQIQLATIASPEDLMEEATACLAALQPMTVA